MTMTVRWPFGPGMMVVVGWIMVPLADRSTAGCCGETFLVALVAAPAGIAHANTAALTAATTHTERMASLIGTNVPGFAEPQ